MPVVKAEPPVMPGKVAGERTSLARVRGVLTRADLLAFLAD
jgi:hypothetical protein